MCQDQLDRQKTEIRQQEPILHVEAPEQQMQPNLGIVPETLNKNNLIEVPLYDLSKKGQKAHDLIFGQWQDLQKKSELTDLKQEEKLQNLRDMNQLSESMSNLISHDKVYQKDKERFKEKTEHDRIIAENLFLKLPKEKEAKLPSGNLNFPEVQKQKPVSEKQKKKEQNRISSEYYEKMQQVQENNSDTLSDTAEFVRFTQSEWAKKNIMDSKVELCDGMKITQKELFSRVQAGDYSNFERLDNALRNGLAMNYMESSFAQLCRPGDSAESFVERMMDQGGTGKLLDPMMRLGISLYMKQKNGMPDTAFDGPEKFKELDMKLNTKIMVETILHKPTRDQARELSKDYPNDIDDDQWKADLKRNKQSRKFVAKMLLMTQLSDFKCINEENGELVEEEWKGDISNAFAHCSRVGFSLPSSNLKKNQEDFLNSILGKKNGLNSGFEKRFSATHALNREGKKEGGDKFKEQKKKLGWLFGQSGMNLAIGGLGNNGIPDGGGSKRLLRNDGSCGHLFMHLKKGNDAHYTGMLLGFESDAYKKANQLGHRHGLGNPEYSSSFGGLRTDEIGAKYGGRQASLSKYNMVDLMNVFSAFDNFLERELDNEKSKKDVQGIINRLASSKMSKNETKSFFKKISFYAEQKKLGILSKIDE